MGFSIELYDLDGTTGAYTRKDVITNHQNLQYYDRKNSIGLAQFNLDGRSAKATVNNLRPIRTIVAIKENNVIKWTGFLLPNRNSYSDVDNKITLKCISYFGRLLDRHTADNVRFDQVAQGTICWDLINYTQNLPFGKLGISQGVTDTSQVRDRSYQNYSIAEAIMNLTEVIDGTNFDLQPVVDSNGILTGHLFNTRATVGSDRFDLPALSLGSSVIAFDAQGDGDLFNFSLYKGSGTGDEYITATAQDNDSLSQYTRTEKYVLREDISEQSTLQSWANRTIAEKKDLTYEINLALRSGSNLNPNAFNLGDRLRLNLDDGDMVTKFVGVCEIVAKEFLVDPQGVLEADIRVKFIVNT